MENKQSEIHIVRPRRSRVISLDFDGCLFNDHYYGLERNVVLSNYSFLNKLKQENTHYKKVYSLIGSNRQSFAVDKHNFIKDNIIVGSCFPAMLKVNHFLGVIFDSFLLADLYGNLQGGKSFQRAIDLSYAGPHSDWIFDFTKITLLYAQMHRHAYLNLKDEIFFDFYDDKHEILRCLANFYSDHSELIPRNMTLRLHHYSGFVPIPMMSIMGIGLIDRSYRSSVIGLARQAIKNSAHQILGWGNTIMLSRRELVDNSRVSLIKKENLEEKKAQETGVTNIHLSTGIDSNVQSLWFFGSRVDNTASVMPERRISLPISKPQLP